MIMKTIKHKIQYCLLCIIACCGMNSCNFLDVDPELGLSDEEVFETYSNFSSYFHWM